jgi:sarcosine oxidase delta subunit
MHAVIRTYSGTGAKQVFDVLDAKKADVEKLIRSVKGFVSYTLMRSGDGGVSVTVCSDKAGCDESLKVARDWIQKNVPNTGAAPPTVAEGSVILQLK